MLLRFSVRVCLMCAVLNAFGVSPCLAAQEAAHNGAVESSAQEENPNPLVFDPDLAIFTFIVFLLLLWILGKFAWPQIVAALDERERKIAENIADAEAKHEEAKRLFAEYQAQLAAAAGEVRAIMEEAKRDADHTRRQGEAEGRKAKEDELARALREIERAKDGAIQELAVASANVAIDLARKVVHERITPEQQASLVREAISKLAATEPSEN